VTRNTSLWSREFSSPSPPIHIVDTLCSNDCSGHGHCSKGGASLTHPFIIPLIHPSFNHLLIPSFKHSLAQIYSSTLSSIHFLPHPAHSLAYSLSHSLSLRLLFVLPLAHTSILLPNTLTKTHPLPAYIHSLARLLFHSFISLFILYVIHPITYTDFLLNPPFPRTYIMPKIRLKCILSVTNTNLLNYYFVSASVCTAFTIPPSILVTHPFDCSLPYLLLPVSFPLLHTFTLYIHGLPLIHSLSYCLLYWPPVVILRYTVVADIL
jgi:hypothetical protein